MRRALLCGVLAALLVPAAAAAHATLKEAHPGEQSRVETPPTEITLRYDQSVTATANSIIVLGADGRRLSGTVTQAAGGTVVRAPVHGLVRGEAYTVRWHEISADGHVTNGVFTFGVGVDAPSPTEAVGSSGQTWRDDVARWVLFVALALLIGVVGIRLLILPRPVDPRVERRIHLLGTLGAVVAVNAGIIGFIIRCANALCCCMSTRARRPGTYRSRSRTTCVRRARTNSEDPSAPARYSCTSGSEPIVASACRTC